MRPLYYLLASISLIDSRFMAQILQESGSMEVFEVKDWGMAKKCSPAADFAVGRGTREVGVVDASGCELRDWVTHWKPGRIVRSW